MSSCTRTMLFLFVLCSIAWVKTEWTHSDLRLTHPDLLMAVGAFNNSIYILGGNNYHKQFYQYDIIKSEFIEDSSMLSYEIYGSSQYYTQSDSKLYMIQSTGDKTLIFDLQSKLFENEIYNIPKNVGSRGCLASGNNYLFIIGGHTDITGSLNTLQILDLLQNKFIPNPPHMQDTRSSASCAYHEGTKKLYAIGGFSTYGTIVYREVEVISTIDIENQEWSYVTGRMSDSEDAGTDGGYSSLSTVRSAVWGDIIFVVGQRAYAIDVFSDSLSYMQAAYTDQPSAAVVIANNILYVIAGLCYQQCSYDYNVVSDTQCYKLPPTPYPTPHPTIYPTYYPTVNPTVVNNNNHQTSVPTSQNNLIISHSTEYRSQKSDTNDKHTNPLLIALTVAAVSGVLIFITVISYVIVKQKMRKRNHAKMSEPIQLLPMTNNESPAQILLDENIQDRLFSELDKYSEVMVGTGTIADINITQALDDYHHLLQSNVVMNSEKECDVESCVIFRRNYRNKCSFKNKHDIEQLYASNININDDNDNGIAICQTLDKIHSFCYHAHDVFDDNHKETDIMKIVQNKMNKKYNQLYRNSVDRQNMFIFGWPFFYQDDINDSKQNDAIIVKPKYSTLRQELTSNIIHKMSMEQFINEYLKAELHFSCAFRRQMYPRMSIEHIISLMVYCNFDELQYEFSKTYREAGNKHENYYHLGNLLKQAVILHGTRIKDGRNKKFYHGISQKLIPSEIVGHLGKGISIYCPLSTSTSLEAATNFTSNNKGLIITFGGEASKAKYFSVSWLSDFGNENESLFLQNKQELQIENIVDCSTSIEYGMILNALKTMDAIMWELHYFKDQKSAKGMAPMIRLIVQMLHHQLSVTLNEFEWERLDNLEVYGQQLLDVYLRNKTKLTINYLVLEQKYPDLFSLFCLNEFDWIRIDTLNAIFANIKEIEITNINLCDKIMESISKNRSIFSYEDGSWNLDKMTIKSNKSSALRAHDAVSKYKQILKENTTKITIRSVDWENDDYDTLLLE